MPSRKPGKSARSWEEVARLYTENNPDDPIDKDMAYTCGQTALRRAGKKLVKFQDISAYLLDFEFLIPID